MFGIDCDLAGYASSVTLPAPSPIVQLTCEVPVSDHSMSVLFQRSRSPSHARCHEGAPYPRCIGSCTKEIIINADTSQFTAHTSFLRPVDSLCLYTFNSSLLSLPVYSTIMHVPFSISYTLVYLYPIPHSPTYKHAHFYYIIAL